MKHKSELEPSNGRFWTYVLAYLSWFVTIALSGLFLLLLHSVVQQWYVIFKLRPAGLNAITRFYFFFGGIFWIAFIFFVEGYFLNGVASYVLRRRLLQVFTALFMLLLSAAALYLLIGPFLGVTS